MNISSWLDLKGKYLYAARTLQSVLHVLRCCSTSHLSPLISSPAAFISTSLFFSPPLFFSSHSVFFLLQNPASPSNLATLSSHPSVLLCCFLPAHYPSPPLRCPPCVLLNTFPAFLLHFLFIRFLPLLSLLPYSLLSVWLFCFPSSSSKFPWPNPPFFSSLHPSLNISFALLSPLPCTASTVFFLSSFSIPLTYPLLVAVMPAYALSLPVSHSVSLSSSHVCGLLLCAHLMAGV